MSGRTVLVCGSRTWADRDRLFALLDAEHAEARIGLIVHGNARGADLMADAWADQNSVPRRVFPANWKAHGKAAGPIRNRRMLEECPDLVIAFWDGESRGTHDMIRASIAAGHATQVYLPEAA